MAFHVGRERVVDEAKLLKNQAVQPALSSGLPCLSRDQTFYSFY